MFSRRLFSTKNLKKLPKLAVFDLDHTIWPFGVDTFCYTPPFHYNDKGQVIDMSSKVIEHFPDIPEVFQYLKHNDIKIAVASRTCYPHGAITLLDRLSLAPKIDYFEVYPGQKIKHFKRISQNSGIDFEHMIFFDDEDRNIVDITQLGVFSVLVPSHTGVSKDHFHQALDKFHHEKNRQI